MAVADSTDCPIVTRKQAQSLGLVRYFPGSTCKNGHTTERLTVNGSCMECARLTRLAKYRADPAADLARQKEYRQAHPDFSAKRKAKRHIADPALAARVTTRAEDKALRVASLALGESMYQSVRSCGNCGTSRRFSSDGKCVECNRVACNRRYQPSPEQVEARALKKEIARLRRERQAAVSARAQAVASARSVALKRGDLTYTGRPCPRGHDGLRYAKHGACVSCASAQATSDEKKRYDREYLERNRERIRARSREYHAAHREQSIRSTRAWAKRNPEKRRAIAQSYTHRRSSQEKDGVSGPEFNAWKKAQRKVCYWCGCKCAKRFVVDHYVPLAKGGKHEIPNLVIACRPCNAAKSAKDPLEFAKTKGRLF